MPRTPLLRSLSKSLLAKEIFEEQGFKVLAAPTGAAALELWKRYSAETVLLFTDMIMPGGMSGRDLSQFLRAERPDLPVVFTSGYSRDMLNGGMNLEEGVNYLPKPYRTGDLSAIISRVLNQAAPASEMQAA